MARTKNYTSHKQRVTSHVMDVQDRAIILRTQAFQESDLLVTLFLEGEGKRRGIAKGAKRSKKRFGNSLEMGSLVSLVYAERSKTDWVFLKEATPLGLSSPWRSSFETIVVAGYAIELVLRLLPERQEAQKKFDLLLSFLTHLDPHRPVDSHGQTLGTLGLSASSRNLSSELCSREGEAPMALPLEGATRAPIIERLLAFEFSWICLSGLGPSLEYCEVCKSPWNTKPYWQILWERGEMVCSDCHLEAKRNFPREVIYFLKTLDSRMLSGPLTPLQKSLDDYWEQTLGKSLASKKLLEKVFCSM